MPALQSLLPIIGNPGVEITGIQYDSRKVKQGDLFACLRGEKADGHDFIPQALASGAVALLVEDESRVPPGVTALVVPDVQFSLAQIAANFYGYPSEHLILIGVTGTNGKTTVTTLLWHILRAAGHPSGLIGTMAYHIGDRVEKAPHTTPMALDLQELLAGMRDAGMTHVVMEVSSHALCQSRIAGCHFRAAAFTNLTQDHLDFHKTMSSYHEAKIQLFTNPLYQPRHGDMIKLVNMDDPGSEEIIRRLTVKNKELADCPARTFGISGGNYLATDIILRHDGSQFLLCHPGGKQLIQLQLVGKFNVYNSLAAIALALELGVAPELAAETLQKIPPVSGRFQRVISKSRRDACDPSGDPSAAERQPTVIVDYAHTPDGLEKVLSTAYEIAPGRVIALFGCGGDRDPLKRPLMAAAAARWARDIVITCDNPRTEDPRKIIDMILEGFSSEERQRVTVEPDRAAAIRLAIHRASADDIVVLAGKGHEDYQIFADRTIHFDDREEAEKALLEMRIAD